MLNHSVLGTILIPAWQRGSMEGEGRADSISWASEGTMSLLLVALGFVLHIPPTAFLFASFHLGSRIWCWPCNSSSRDGNGKRID